MVTVLKLLALVVIVGLTGSSCTNRSEVHDTTSTPTVEPTTSATKPPQTPTTTVPDFSGLTIDDLILSRRSSHNIDSISAEARVTCESAVLALSAVMQLLMPELDEALVNATIAVQDDRPVSEIVALFDTSAAAVAGVHTLTSGLSQQLGIGGAITYTRLVNQALKDLQLSSNILTGEELDSWIRSIGETIESIRDQELIVRLPVWECPALRP
jgi:hypothetical protein